MRSAPLTSLHCCVCAAQADPQMVPGQKLIPYYLAHCSLTQAYLTDEKVSSALDAMPHEYLEGKCMEMCGAEPHHTHSAPQLPVPPALRAPLKRPHRACGRFEDKDLLTSLYLPSVMYKAPFDDLECVYAGFEKMYQRYIAAKAPATSDERGSLTALAAA